jgi:RNA polymerase sigma-70 factor (ECF subfamily)
MKQEERPPLVVPEDVRQWFAASPVAGAIPPACVREWLGELVRANYRLLYSIAYRYFPNTGTAQDQVQSAVLKGLQKLNRLQNPDAVLAWLARITRNECLQTLRQGVESDPLDDVDEVVAPNNLAVYRAEERRHLFAAINKLPEKIATVVHLRFFADYEIAEIADRLGLRRNTVEVRLHRALKELAKEPVLQALKGVVER